jgi:hypothetical protein
MSANERGLGRGLQAPEYNSGDSPSAFPHERLVQEIYETVSNTVRSPKLFKFWLL